MAESILTTGTVSLSVDVMSKRPRPEPESDEPAMGRPPRVPGVASKHQVAIRLTTDEYTAWEAATKAAGESSIVAWARGVCNRSANRSRS